MHNVLADQPQEDEETTVYTIRGIKKSLDDTITDLANRPTESRRPPWSVSSLRNISATISAILSCTARWYVPSMPKLRITSKLRSLTTVTATFTSPATTTCFLKLLGIDSEEQLRTLLLNNAPYLRLRADQVCAGFARIPRGLSLTFAMFAELGPP